MWTSKGEGKSLVEGDKEKRVDSGKRERSVGSGGSGKKSGLGSGEESGKRSWEGSGRGSAPPWSDGRPRVEQESTVAPSALGHSEGRRDDGRKTEGRGAWGGNSEGWSDGGRDAEGRDAEGGNAEGRNADGRDAEGRNAEGRNAEGRDAEGRDAEGSASSGQSPSSEARATKEAEKGTREGFLRGLKLRAGVGGKSGRVADMRRSESRVFATALKGWKAQGRKNYSNFKVSQETTWLSNMQNAYSWIIKLPPLQFVLAVLSAPALLALLFTPLFLLKWDGFGIKEGSDKMEELLRHSDSSSFWGMCSCRVTIILHVFIYALSICTSFGGSPLSAMSPRLVFLANLLTLLAQLLFVFVSGAVFARIARPGDAVLASDKIIISRQLVPGYGDEKPRVIFTRIALVGVNMQEIVAVNLSMVLRVALISPTGSLFVSAHDLPLMRGEVHYLRYGFILRHVVDETSPLYGYSAEDLEEGDGMFSIHVSAMERSTMHPIFYTKDYFVHDGEVAYDREFEDMLLLGKKEGATFDHARLSLLKPVSV